MNTTLTNQGRATRTKQADAHKAVKKRAVADTLQTIAGELADAEAAIASCDERLAESERLYLEAIAPLLKERTTAEVAYTRSRAAQTFLASGELDRADAWESAARRHAEAVAALEAAEAAFEAAPCPSGDRRQLVLDRDKWAEVQAHGWARDARQAAERELNEAEMQCRSLGVPVDVTPDTESTHGAQRRPRHNRMEGAM
jgi:hypothetical protein